MNKKIITLILISVLILLGIFLYYQYSQKALVKNEVQTKQTADYSNEMGGHITEVKNGSIVVEGTARASDPNSTKYEKKTIEFTITPQTVFKKTVQTIPQGVKPGQAYSPDTKESQGSGSDLAAGIRILKLQSKENLFAVDKATAVEINYAIFEFPGF